ncbi:MAG TPA: ubiquitin-like small modifier protein 1 [Acidimicrobiales bacterium]|nr:ubiquitin-like small modifier protein 1 [Acidimicrobiales bacterium]
MTVKLPTVLRPHAGGERQVDAAGATVGEVMGDLIGRFPSLKDQLFETEASLRRFVNVYLNDDDIRYLGGLEAGVSDGDRLTILPAVAGG